MIKPDNKIKIAATTIYIVVISAIVSIFAPNDPMICGIATATIVKSTISASASKLIAYATRDFFLCPETF